MLKTSPLIFIPVRNGLIAGVVGFCLLLALYFMGKHPFLFNIFFDFRIILFGIFLALTVREIRDNYQDGIIFFWQGMIACLVFTIAFAIIIFALIWILCIAFPPFVSTYITTALDQARNFPPEVIDKIGKDVFEQSMKELEGVTGYYLAKHYFWQSFVISFFLSIIISVILRRQPKND